MSEPRWYYAVDRLIDGPVSESELIRRLTDGRVPLTALAFAEGISPDWQPVGDIACFQGIVVRPAAPAPALAKPAPAVRRPVAPAPVPATATAPTPAAAPPPVRRRVAAAQTPGTNPGARAAPPPMIVGVKRAIPTVSSASTSQAPRPWARYFARLFDIWLSMIPTIFLWGFLMQGTGLGPRDESFVWVETGLFIFLLTATLAVYEGIALSTAGATLGKWFFGIEVRTSSGEKLPFDKAFGRSLSVTFRGMGMFVPFVTLFTLLAAHNKLTAEGATSWERDGGYSVQYYSGWLGWTILLLGAAWIFLLIANN